MVTNSQPSPVTTSRLPSLVTTSHLPSLITISLLNTLINSLATRLPNLTIPAVAQRTTPQQQSLTIRQRLTRRHFITARPTPRLLTTPRAGRHTKRQQPLITNSRALVIIQRLKPITSNHLTRHLLTTPTITMLTRM